MSESNQPVREQPPEQISDPGEFVQRRRSEEVLNARRAVLEAADEALFLTQEELELVMRERMSSFIREIQGLLKNHAQGPLYWEGKALNEEGEEVILSHLGTLSIPTPDPVEVAWRYKLKDWADHRGMPKRMKKRRNQGKLPLRYHIRSVGNQETTEFQVVGLKDYLQFADRAPLSKELTVKLITPNEGLITESQPKSTDIPVHITKNAFDLASDFLNQVGMDLKSEEGLPNDMI